jgi:hypothetical protein
MSRHMVINELVNGLPWDRLDLIARSILSGMRGLRPAYDAN